MITITENARKKILEYRAAAGRPGLGLRVLIRGRAFGGFQYELGFVEEGTQGAEDTVVDAGEFKVYVDPATGANLKGATLDFLEGVQESGFRVDNPNPLWTDPVALAVQKVIDEKLNPALAGHGGWVMLVGVEGDTAYVTLGGGCQGCGRARVTLKDGVEEAIRQGVPEIANVVDTTDHAAGANPYYERQDQEGP